jgi:hypothetical protein
MPIDPKETSNEKKITVEQAFNICLTFYNDLWPSIEPKLPGLNHDAAVVHDLFFTNTCIGFECSGEWMEAVFRITKISKIEQKRNLMLTEKEAFLCVVEFCKVCKELFKWDLGYILNLLDSMRSDPLKHSFEWSIWKQAVERSFTMQTNDWNLDWNAKL